MNPAYYRISSRSSRGSHRSPQQPVLSTVQYNRDLEEGGRLLPPGAFRVEGNRSLENDDVASMGNATAVSAPSVAEEIMISVPEAQLVDPNETEDAIARAVEEATEQRERAIRAEQLLQEEAQERKLLQQRVEQTTDRMQPHKPQLMEREEGGAELAEEDRSTGFLVFVRKHSVLSCAFCSVLLLGAVGAVLGVAISGSSKKGKGEDTSPRTKLPVTNEPTPRPTVVATTSPPSAAHRVFSWTQVGSTLKGVARGDRFGTSNALALSSDGTILAVGAPLNDEAVEDSGRVQVFQLRRGATDLQQANAEWQPMGVALTGVAEDDLFGTSVALSATGQILAVGATESFADGPGYVRIFAYDRTNGNWNQRGSRIEGGASEDRFGESLALSSDGNTLAVGAPLGNFAGRVHVFAFESNSNDWVPKGSTLTGAASGNWFGSSLDLSADGTILAGGAPYNGDNGINSGHVRAFQFNSISNDWDQLGAAIPGVAESDEFGRSVALSISGMVLAAGARYNDDNGSDSGHVRVFHYNTSSNQWILRGSAIAGVAEDDRFGCSVALSADGNQVAAGARRNDDIATSSGHIRVFQYEESSSGTTTGQWKHVGEALTGVGGSSDYFGRSVATSADGMVVAGGADESYADFEGPGYVFVYEGVAEWHSS